MDERRSEQRGLLASYSNPVYRGLRTAIEKAGTVYGAVGIFLIAGLIVGQVVMIVVVAALFLVLAGGYSEIRRSSRSENPGGREARAGSTPGRVFGESLTSASPSTFSTKTWVSSSTLS